MKTSAQDEKSTDGINSNLDVTEKNNSKCQDRAIETIQNET